MTKYPRKPKLTDAERSQRFVDMAKEIGALEEAKSFDDVVRRVAKQPPRAKETRSKKIGATITRR
jgi:hypothetical protein